MINTAKKQILIPLAEAGWKSAIAGGSIRSLLFDEEPHDCDIVTNAPEETVRRLFYVVEDISKNMHLKVFLVTVGGYKYEIARLRAESKTSDHRRPEYVRFVDDFKYDAERRDFTVNAMFLASDGSIIDYFGGRDDIAGKVLRCVGNPAERFDEDVLRILRGIRFAVKYDLRIEDGTREAMRVNAKYLIALPPVRITGELDKMMDLGGFRFSRALKIMRDTGVLDVILPEVAALKNFFHDKLYHPESCKIADRECKNCTLCTNTVLNHVIESVRVCQLSDTLVLWAVLLHDVGKAQCFAVKDKDGQKKLTYHAHEKAGVAIIEQIAERLKLPVKTKKVAQFCTEKHMMCHKLQEMKPAKVLKLMEHRFFNYLMEVADCDVLCRGDLAAAEEIRMRSEFTKKFRVLYNATRLVNGLFILENTDMEPGPKIGEIIEKLRNFIVTTGEIDMEVIKDKLKKCRVNRKSVTPLPADKGVFLEYRLRGKM
ncbi:MAG: CCA tRNA nucleotidyltransferase [Desulfovibrio sp.]|jgi:tRNA nucleotidyltransferase/poly(A) polymerase|nr:CCA tRNA nucleotidyltransferase [Desulfovibrio sp.]